MIKKNHSNSQALDQERVYALLREENWKELLSFIWSNSNLIASDDILKNAAKTCEQVFFSNLEKERESESFPNDLATLFALHTNGKYLLSNANAKTTVLLLVAIWSERDLATAKSYAEFFPEDPISKAVIAKYKETLPKYVEHSQTGTIQVTRNRDLSVIDARATLFKSQQERDFFYGVRNCFPHFIVYPNVALSCLFDLERIRERLSKTEIDYFFRGIVDCVVFDSKQTLLLPKYFFELDSIFHDSAPAREKDQMKDRIFAAAGQTLLRVRKYEDKESQADFEQLVKEVTETL